MTERGRRTKFDDRREATRALLIDQGLDLILRQGYAGTSVTDVIRDTGLTRGAFYFHFPSKEHWFLALMEARRTSRGTWYEAGADPANATLRAAIVDAARRIDDTKPESNERWLVAMVEFAQDVSDRPEVKDLLKPFLDDLVEEMDLFLTRLDARGLIRGDKPTRELATAILALSEGRSVIVHLGGDGRIDLLDAYLRLLSP